MIYVYKRVLILQSVPKRSPSPDVKVSKSHRYTIEVPDSSDDEEEKKSYDDKAENYDTSIDSHPPESFNLVELASATSASINPDTSQITTVYYVKTSKSDPFSSLACLTSLALPPLAVILYHTSSSSPSVNLEQLDGCLHSLSKSYTIVRWYGEEWSECKRTVEAVVEVRMEAKECNGESKPISNVKKTLTLPFSRLAFV